MYTAKLLDELIHYFEEYTGSKYWKEERKCC